MSINPAISVILPVFNGEKYLREAIDSILNQSLADFELIIVNDGSVDGSLEIIHSYPDSRIKVIQNPQNLGLVGALNVGIAHAKGKYLARQDQDDVSHPDRLKLQLAKLEVGNIDICGTRWATLSSDGVITCDTKIPLTEDTILASLATTVPFAHGSVMIRKDFMAKHRLQYDENYLAEDYSLWVKLAGANAHFANIDQDLYFYRVHPQSLSFVKRDAYRQSAKLLRRAFVEQNLVRCHQILDRLTESDKAIKALNYRETIYVAMLAYRLPLSSKALKQFLKIFWQASLRLKLHILYTALTA